MALESKSKLMWELCSRGFPVPQSLPKPLIDSGVWNTAHAASKIAGWPHHRSEVSSDKNQLSPIREGQSETGLLLQTASESDQHKTSPAEIYTTEALKAARPAIRNQQFTL